MLERAITYAEQLFGIKLDRREKTTRVVTNEHNAFTNCPIAKFFKARGHKHFAIHDEKHKIEYAWDESDWIESEFYGANQDYHSENFEHEFSALYRGDVSPIKNSKNVELLANMQETQISSLKSITDSFEKSMNDHMSLLTAMNGVVTDLKKSVQLRDKMIEKLIKKKKQ